MLVNAAKSFRRWANQHLQVLLFDSLVKRVGQRGAIEDPRAAFNYMARGNFGILSAIQSRNELLPLLEMIREERPSAVLEIGTANGGTLFALTRVASPDAIILSLDLPDGPWGGGYSARRVPLYKAMALPGQTIHLLREDSHQPEALEGIRERLAGKTIDLLFIDGDHSYEGVKQDFEMYSPLVTPGGFIAFHDIAYTDGVARLWRELKTQFTERHEFISPVAPVYGIGLVRTITV